MHRKEIQLHLETLGLKADQWGNYHYETTRKDGSKRQSRFHFGKRALRLETKNTVSGRWFRIRSAFYSEIKINPLTQKLTGLKA